MNLCDDVNCVLEIVCNEKVIGKLLEVKVMIVSNDKFNVFEFLILFDVLY